MKNNIIPIVIEKEGVSDDSYNVVELYFKNGDSVKKGQLIFCIETSKAAIEVESPISGFVFYNMEENDKVGIGKIAAAISDTNSIPDDWFASNDSSKPEATANETGVRISKPAQRLIDENNIDIFVFGAKELITKEDVLNYLNASEESSLEEITINEKSLLVYGGGGHAKMCIETLKHSDSYEMIGIVDSKLPIHSKVLGLLVLGRENILDGLVKDGLKNAVLGIGVVLNHGIREKLFILLKEKGLFIPTIIHPSASVEPSALLGEGNQIMQGAIIGPDVKIGNNCIINSGSIISHDSVIGDNVHIAPGAIIAGSVTIADNSVVGMGATVFLGVTIGKNVTINNGVNIISDIADNMVIKDN